MICSDNIYSRSLLELVLDELQHSRFTKRAITLRY